MILLNFDYWIGFRKNMLISVNVLIVSNKLFTDCIVFLQLLM